MSGPRVQIRSSVMNDGNYAFVEYQDAERTGPIDRIDVYRCSQPAGGFGVTGSGTKVEALCSTDLLTPSSNRIFRNIYSHGPGPTTLPALLETREEFNTPGLPVGSWEERIRDVDPASDSYGRIMRIVVSPVVGQTGKYNLTYEIRGTGIPLAQRVPINSPLTTRVTELAPALVDLGVSLEQLPPIDMTLPGNPMTFVIDGKATRQSVNETFALFTNNFQTSALARWRSNFYKYESFGDLGLKSTHPGTNLVGPASSVDLIRELLVFRAYR